MNRLVFKDGEWSALRQRLLQDSPLEAAAVLFANLGMGRYGSRFVVTDIWHPDAADYLARSKTSAVLDPSFIARVLQKARRDRQCLFLTHTHPFEARPAFSFIDAEGEHKLAPTLYHRVPPGPHGSLVLGTEAFSARSIGLAGEVIEKVDSASDVGPHVRVDFADGREDDEPNELYDRNIRAFGKAGQKLLARLQVGVVGVGGTGSVAVEELARLGVGHLLLIDDEVVETTNLNRLIGSSLHDVGRPKVEVMADLALRANPGITVSTIAGSVLREEVGRRLLDCDFVFCCTDSHGSRAIVNQIAYQFLVPTIDVGIRIDAELEQVSAITTRVQMLAPGLSCLACHPLLDPDAVRRDLMSDDARSQDPYIVGFHEPQPAVVSINATATSAAVTMFLAAVTGLPGQARHIVGRPLEGITRPVVSNPNPQCIVCSPANAFARADTWKMMWLPEPACG